MILSDYVTGTITLTNGSAAFTGTGTGWLAGGFQEGDTIFDVTGATEYMGVIASITTDGAGTLTKNWEGPTVTAPYRMRYQPDGSRVTAQARQLIELLGNGNLLAFSELNGAAGNLVPMFNGAGSMVLVPKTDLTSGANYDVQVADLAARATYDGQTTGYAVLVSNVGDGRSAIYSKNSDTSADWSDPAYVTGPQGDMPTIEATVTPVAIGTAPDVTVTPIAGGYSLDFDLPLARGAGFQYEFSTTTTDADPGAGFWRANNAAFTSATQLFISKTSDVGASMSAFLLALDDSTSTIKGDLVFQRLSDGITASWKVTAVTDATNYVKVAVSGYAGPTVLTNNDIVMLQFNRTGDLGSSTGDVVGPAVAVADRIAVFDGTTGKLIKDGGKAISELAPARYVAFVNGGAGSEYDLGVTRSSNPLSFGAAEIVNARSEQQTPTILKDNSIKGAPSPVIVGNEIYVYYDGYGTGVPNEGNIFLEVYDLDGNPKFRSITPIIRYTFVAGAISIARPQVLYEPSDVAAPFKMVFCSRTAAGLNQTVHIAYSLNGWIWTYIGVAFSVGAGGTWDDNGVTTTGRLVKYGGVYHIFYGGHDGTQFKGGEASNAAWVAAGWTKNASNPLLVPRGPYNLSLTLTATGGTKWFRVGSNTDFDLNASVMLWKPSDPTLVEMQIIESKAGATDLGIYQEWLGTYDTTYKVSQVHSRSVDFSEVWFDPVDSKWKTLFTCFGFCADANRETMAYAETSNLSSGFTIHPEKRPSAYRPRSIVWDRYSSENLKFVKVS